MVVDMSGSRKWKAGHRALQGEALLIMLEAPVSPLMFLLTQFKYSKTEQFKY